MSKKKERYIEAGSATMLWLFGKSWDIVKIDMQAEPGKRLQVRDCIYKVAQAISKTKLPDQETEQFLNVEAKIAVMYFLSGFAMKGRLRGRSDWLDYELNFKGWGNDREHHLYRAVQVVQVLYGKSKKADLVLHYWARWCDEIFVNKKVWECIEAVAEYLNQSKKPVTGLQIKNMMLNVWPLSGIPLRALGKKWRERFDL